MPFISFCNWMRYGRQRIPPLLFIHSRKGISTSAFRLLKTVKYLHSILCLPSLTGSVLYSTTSIVYPSPLTAVDYRGSVLASSGYTFSSFVSNTAHAGAAMRSLNDSTFANTIITGLRIIEWRRLIHCLAHNRQSNSYNVPCQLLENALPTSFASYSPHSVETRYRTVHVSDRDRYT